MSVLSLSLAVVALLDPAWAASSSEVDAGVSGCQAALERTYAPMVQRLTVAPADATSDKVALLSVIPDFDAERDIVVGVVPGKHTYLINAQIGRHDPGMYGGRGKFHPNTSLRWLRVSPGLVVRLRLAAPVVVRVAAEMARWRGRRGLTCSNTIARSLARAGVPGMSPFMLTPLQILRAIKHHPELDARYYVLNSDAEGPEEFEDRIKVIGAKRPVQPPAEDRANRRTSSASCDKEDCSNMSIIACLDLDSCNSASPASECGSGESACCESGASECGGSESGGSECGDSDCGS